MLDTSKRRLLYALNELRLVLYNNETFQAELSKISLDWIDIENSFHDFYIMSRLFLIDILENSINDENTLRKLLFIKTYYNLTKDKRIKDLIERYSNRGLYQRIKSVVLENGKSMKNHQKDLQK